MDNTILRAYNGIRPVHYSGISKQSRTTKQHSLNNWHVEACAKVYRGNMEHGITSRYPAGPAKVYLISKSFIKSLFINRSKFI